MNMRTVALKAGVSSATVSRVINGSALVSPETAEHVRRVIEDLQFIPNPVATTLKYGRSRTYGLIIPDITNPFYPEFLLSLEELLIQIDHELMLANVGSSSDALVHSIRRMLMRQVDGVFLLASEFETRSIEPLLAHKVPLVTTDRRRAEEGVSDVAIDFESGYSQAVAHLAALGHKRIAFVGGSKGLRTSAIRFNAFRKGLEGHGLTVYPELFREGDYRVEGGEVAARSLLAGKRRPTAIMTANDLTAFGVLRELHRTGIDIPRDMSVVGMDDIAMCDVLYPALTTVRIDRRVFAAACLQALEYTKAHMEQHGRRSSIPATLVIRATTARPTRTRP